MAGSGEEIYTEAIKDGKKLLGICLGAQLIADALGGKVFPNKFKEIGWYPVTLKPEMLSYSPFFGIPKSFMALHWHGDTFEIPSGAENIGSSLACGNQGFIFNDRVIGLQFHLEATDNSITALIENCKNELVEDKWIQKPGEITTNSNRYLPAGK